MAATSVSRLAPHTAQMICQEMRSAIDVIPRIALIHTKPCQDQVDGAALRLLHRIQSIIQIADRLSAFGLAHSSAQRVVTEVGNACCPLFHFDQLVARVPDIGAYAVGKQVAVGVVAERLAIGLGLTVVTADLRHQAADLVVAVAIADLAQGPAVRIHHLHQNHPTFQSY